MAQWSRADRTLYAKLVYYGPAFGGKTTNLQALHRITDPTGTQKLLTVKTSDDRTLFFDLLPFDLGDILGYQVAMKLYTVPGQVRYDTTRQVVLSGADAIVFVADSTTSRQDQNVWSLQNLYMNMRAKRMDPTRIPMLFQFNKQDLAEAAPPIQVARSLGLKSESDGFPAVALEGRGVLETFMAACNTMIERLVALADDRTRREIDLGELGRQLDRAFAPYLARQRQGPLPPRSEPTSGPQPIVPQGDDLLAGAVQTGLQLGEQLTVESARSARLEKEAEAFRRLSESLRSVGASFERTRIVDAGLAAAARILQAPVISLVHRGDDGQTRLERGWGCNEDPLLTCDAGRELISRMQAASTPVIVDDLSTERFGAEGSQVLSKLRAAAAVPVEADGARLLVAYAPEPDGSFRQEDVRFMTTIAGHIAVGLEKARLHEELTRSRDRLEEIVTSRTEQLRQAYEELRSVERMKDRFLSNLSHEMKTPLTAVLSSAHVLRDYKSAGRERKELVEAIVGAARTLERQLDDLFRLVNLQGGAQPLHLGPASVEQLVTEALELAGSPPVKTPSLTQLPRIQADLPRLARALANIVDNAIKFSPPGTEVEIQASAIELSVAGTSVDGIALAVLDRGSGVPPRDRERIFAPFEQGGDPLTAKPRGIGIGLYESRTISRRHGGDVEYRPREGGGSVFRLSIPLVPAGHGMLIEPVQV